MTAAREGSLVVIGRYCTAKVAEFFTVENRSEEEITRADRVTRPGQSFTFDQ